MFCVQRAYYRMQSIVVVYERLTDPTLNKKQLPVCNDLRRYFPAVIDSWRTYLNLSGAETRLGKHTQLQLLLLILLLCHTSFSLNLLFKTNLSKVIAG